MRKIAAILLLGLLSFNWVGYRLLISFYEDVANLQLETRLDNSRYDDGELISFKVPLTNLAYYTNAKLFERVDGQIEIKGVLYNFVKQRLYNDSLELLCIPNTAGMKLRMAKVDLLKLASDLVQTGQGKKTNNQPSNTKYFSLDHYTIQDFIELNDFFAEGAESSFYLPFFTSSPYYALIENPPENFSMG